MKIPESRVASLIDRYYRGTGATALERIKWFKLVWDAIGTEFGGRHELYERNYAGNHEQIASMPSISPAAPAYSISAFSWWTSVCRL